MQGPQKILIQVMPSNVLKLKGKGGLNKIQNLKFMDEKTPTYMMLVALVSGREENRVLKQSQEGRS